MMVKVRASYGLISTNVSCELVGFQRLKQASFKAFFQLRVLVVGALVMGVLVMGVLVVSGGVVGGRYRGNGGCGSLSH